MQNFISQLLTNHLDASTAAVWCVSAVVFGAAGGAIGGAVVGGKHMGYGLAAMMGSFFGPIAALPGVIITLVALSLV